MKTKQLSPEKLAKKQLRKEKELRAAIDAVLS